MRMLLMKRLVDIVISITLLLILFFPLAILTIYLTIYFKSTPFYLPIRAGRDGVCFKQFKFKTMNEDLDENGVLLPDELRITKFGEFLRKNSIDELAQLINVLKGDISLVGPRPLTPDYILYYTQEEYKRLLVKPGITGWAQINGRNSITWKEKFKFDLEYIERQSFLFDLKILILTVKVVIGKKGITQNGYVSSERYHG